MPRELYTHFLPTLFEPAELEGGIAVVIDVLRASTTICHALDAGATAVMPCETVELARHTAEAIGRDNVILGGERHGKLIDGFDLDNSPFAYTEGRVSGKTVVFTTTNGTKALSRCSQADRILIGTFNNLGAILDALLNSSQPIHLVCAGTNGHISQEDILFAGAVVGKIRLAWGHIAIDQDETRIAADSFQRNAGNNLPEALANSRGGRNLRALGMDHDISRAAEIDRFHFVPIYDQARNRIVRQL